MKIGDTVLYIHRTLHVNTPYYGTVQEISDTEGGSTYCRVKFVSRGAGAPDGWHHDFELEVVEGTAEEREREHSSAPLPRWA